MAKRMVRPMAEPQVPEPSSSNALKPPAAILFDLDGTLLDTAPDLGAALNRMLERRGFEPLAPEVIRPHVSRGSRGLTELACQHRPMGVAADALRDEFLEEYAAAICVDSCLFEGMAQVLAEIEASACRWGIVTNKPGWLTDPLLAALGLDKRAACVVSGDTTAHAKPHPLPLLHAAGILTLSSADCLYVGDDLRDIQAARAAGMPVVAAGYGYVGVDSPPAAWGADAVLTHPAELRAFLPGV